MREGSMFERAEEIVTRERIADLEEALRRLNPDAGSSMTSLPEAHIGKPAADIDRHGGGDSRSRPPLILTIDQLRL
jgi:hypothetical protein